jgi:hypothetical protein
MQQEAIPLGVLPSCKVLCKVDKFIDSVVVKLLVSATSFSPRQSISYDLAVRFPRANDRAPATCVRVSIRPSRIYKSV